MDRMTIGHIIRFLSLVALQILLLNNVQFSGILNPYLYVYFLLVLPVDFSPNLGLVLGFLLGFTIDVFTQTLGMHTIATTFAAYCRPYILTYMAPRDSYEFARIPGIRHMGWLWFTTYAGILIMLHHFVLFFVEMFRMSGLWMTLGKSLSSAVITLILALALQMLFSSRKSSASSYE